MAQYEKIIPFVLKYEGIDTVTDDKHDKGGKTKYGISLKYAQRSKHKRILDKDQNGIIDGKDIELLELDDALDLYKLDFWDVARLDQVSSNRKAFVFFDMIVNSGLRNATGVLQRALQDLGHSIKVDMSFGPKTFAHLEEADENQLIAKFLELRERFFRRIVEIDPTQKRFINGWLNRLDWIRRDINKV